MVSIEQQIYTSSEEGYGNTGGLQVKAKSRGITEDISSALLHYCSHYHVVERLHQLERQHYRSGRNELPRDVLAQFPTVTMYHQVQHELYGLTRITYLGKDHSGRPGNFVAHSLVFPLDMLAELDHNPLIVKDSPLFDIDIATTGLDLDSPTSWGIPTPPAPDHGWIAEIAAHDTVYPKLVDAVIRQTTDAEPKPLILSFTDAQQTETAIQALLMLLPPASRCRTTFTTYEPDPYALLPRSNSIHRAPHIIATLAPSAGGVFGFRPDELERYRVWDFARGQANSSQFKPASAYAHTIISLLQTHGEAGLTDAQRFLTQLGAGDKPDTWDNLINAYTHPSGLLTSDTLDTLKAAAITSDQAAYALSLITTELGTSLIGTQEPLAHPIIATSQQLFKQLSANSPEKESAQQAISELTAQALASGQWEQAEVLLTIDPADQPILITATRDLAQQGWLDLRQDTPAARHALAVLEPLVARLDEPNWVIDQVWQMVTALAAAPIDVDYYMDLLNTFTALHKALDPADPLVASISEQATELVPALLQHDHPTYAHTMLTLVTGDPAPALTHLLDDLADRGWSTEPLAQPPSPEDQTALVDLLAYALHNVPLTTPDYVLGALRYASAYDVAQSVWDKLPDTLDFLTRAKADDVLAFFEAAYDIPDLAAGALVARLAEFTQRFKNNEPNLYRIFSLAHDLDLTIPFWDQVSDWDELQTRLASPQSRRFSDDLIAILMECHHNQAVFDVLMLRLSADPPSDVPGWQTQVNRMLPHLIATDSSAAQNLRRLLDEASERLAPTDYTQFAGSLQMQFYGDENYDELYDVIAHHGRRFRRKLSVDDKWKVREVLLQLGAASGDALAAEFWTDIELDVNRNANLNAWHQRILHSSDRVRFMSTRLVTQAAAHPEISHAILCDYLAIFGDLYPQACQTPVLMLGQNAVQDLNEQWEPTYAAIEPDADADPRLVNRFKLVRVVRAIQADLASPDPSCALRHLEAWYALRSDATDDDWQWSKDEVSDIFGIMDLTGPNVGQYMAPLIGEFVKHQSDRLAGFLLSVSDRPEYQLIQFLFVAENSIMSDSELTFEVAVEVAQNVFPQLPSSQQSTFLDSLQTWIDYYPAQPIRQRYETFLEEIQPSGMGKSLRRLFKRPGQRR